MLFQTLWMLVVTLNKTKFSLRKILLNFSKISVFGWMLVIVRKIEFTSWQILITSHAHLYARLLPPLLFSLKHWHVIISHMKFQVNLKKHNVFQCVSIMVHSSNLKNVENLTRNFRQSFQIYCREREKEENNGNCKAFCVTRTCKKGFNKVV